MVHGQILDRCAVDTVLIDRKFDQILMVGNNPPALLRDARAGDRD